MAKKPPRAFGQSNPNQPANNSLLNKKSTRMAPNPKDAIALPVLKNPTKEAALVAYILERVKLSDIERKRRIDRMTAIDIQMSGFIKLDKDDEKRKRDNQRGKPPKPTKHNLALTAAQIDECTTYLMSVFAPDMNIFVATSRADKQPMADGLMKEVNNKGQRVGYYDTLARMCTDALKYNFGGIVCYWEEHTGIVFKKSAAGQVQKDTGTVWEGNYLRTIDPYNFFYDTSKHPVELPLRGEYFAEVEVETPFAIKRMAADKKMFGINRFIDAEGKAIPQNKGLTFYQEPPDVRDSTTNMGSGMVNWAAALRDGGGSAASQATIEKINYVGWIIPSDFDLSDSDEMELWRITMVQSQFIVFGIKLEDSHGMLPCAITTPIRDSLKNNQRTYAEQLLPLQHVSSFLMNTHQDALRKAIYGITLYNPHYFPMLDKGTEDMVGAVVPMRSSGTDIDIDKVFRHYNAAPETWQNVDGIEKINQIMQKILPTDMLKQVADLERATLYQAASTVQAGNRRNLKIARTISDHALTPIKFQMIYNMYANLIVIDYTDPATGQTQQASVADLLDAQIEFDAGTGLRGIDKLMQLQILEKVFNAVIQSQQALQEIDIVALLNYFTSIAGDDTDIAQFRRAQPLAPPQNQGGASPGQAGTIAPGQQQAPAPSNAPAIIHP